MKLIITESKRNRAITKWLDENYGDLEPYKTDKYPDYIIYKKGEEAIFDYNKKNGVVCVNYNEIWSFFESYFSMEYQQIQDVIKEWVEERYNLRVTKTLLGFYNNIPRWRNVTI